MNRTQTIPMPPHVRWDVECPILGNLRRCSWDREHGLTIEGLTSEESQAFIKGMVIAAMAEYQKNKGTAPTSAAPPPMHTTVRSGRVQTAEPNVANTPKSEESSSAESESIKTGPEPGPDASDPPGVAQRRRVNWSRRKNFDGKPIKDIKVMSNGGAAILFEDGSGCSTDAYGTIVSRQTGSMAAMAVQGEDSPHKEAPSASEEQTELPVSDGTPEEPVTLVSDTGSSVEVTDCRQREAPVGLEILVEPETTLPPDPNAELDMEALGLTEDMILSCTATIEHLYRVKGIRTLSELIAICEKLRKASAAFERVKDMKKRLRSACLALGLDCT